MHAVPIHLHRPHACCQFEHNMKPHWEKGWHPLAVCARCVVCGCRHFEVNVEPFTIGVEIKPIGG